MTCKRICVTCLIEDTIRDRSMRWMDAVMGLNIFLMNNSTMCGKTRYSVHIHLPVFLMCLLKMSKTYHNLDTIAVLLVQPLYFLSSDHT